MTTSSAKPLVRVYVLDYCPWCRRVEELLAKKGVAFEAIDVTDRPELRSWLLEASGGQRTLPQVFIGDHHIGGYDATAALNRSGELDRLLQAGG
jgi:glutaredoxin 3